MKLSCAIAVCGLDLMLLLLIFSLNTARVILKLYLKTVFEAGYLFLSAGIDKVYALSDQSLGISFTSHNSVSSGL